MVFAIWNTSVLNIWAAESRTELRPLDCGRLRQELERLSALPVDAADVTADIIHPEHGRMSVPVVQLSPASAVRWLMSIDCLAGTSGSGAVATTERDESVDVDMLEDDASSTEEADSPDPISNEDATDSADRLADTLIAPARIVRGKTTDATLTSPGLKPVSSTSEADESTVLSIDSLRVWRTLADVVVRSMAASTVYPSLRKSDHEFIAVWQPLVGGRGEYERLERFAYAIPASCRAAPGLAEMHPLRIVESFLTETTDALVREAVAGDEFFHRVHQRPAAIDVRWLSALLGSDNRLAGDSRELQQLYDDVHLWLLPITDAGEQNLLRLGLMLREPDEGATEWPLGFALVGEGDDPPILPAAELWRQQASPLTSLGRTVAERQERFGLELIRAAELLPPLERALTGQKPTGMLLSPVEAFAFMRSWGFALEEAGVYVDLPDWAAPEESELSLRLQIVPENDPAAETDAPVDPSAAGNSIISAGRMGLDALVRFDWRIAIGQTQLTIGEFESLVNQQSPLVRFRGRWVQIDLAAAAKAHETMTKEASGQMTLGQAFRVGYGLSGTAGVPIGGLSGAEWIGRLLDQSPDEAIQQLGQPEDFKGELRPYQLRGLQWMAYLDRLGLGACLADDMGLGKTIQFIALLLLERSAPGQATPAGLVLPIEAAPALPDADCDADKVARPVVVNNREPAPNPGPTLLFAPASVIGNWTRELERFAPGLRVLAHHGPTRAHGEAFKKAAAEHDVVLTGYALAHRDQEDFRSVLWNRLALDEAQKVKNPSSAASGAIRSIGARRRVALTGTPIENHLSELWSIMEVLNPGLLGSPAQFRERFVIPVEKMADKNRGRLLRELIRPFVLRRTKQDPEVAVNLPSKMEMRVFTSLTPEQAAMYERITSEMLSSVENASGIRRRGLILAGLTRLKQICDHPALLTDDRTIDNRSGKCERLADMLEEVLDEGDAALVFTQYREMGHLLEKMIAKRLGHETLFLHGGVPVKDRDKMIERFQAAEGDRRIFILSLRAGGLGLNLTAANHVFHFDRWWNPAVEAQATDRAHRIGQNKIVQVHKFVSIGTVEERIDKLLAEKTALAENIVTSGDQWLTNLSTDDLKNYLSLSSEAVEETG